MIFKFKGHIPVVHPSSFVHEQATLIGNVIIGKDCYIGPGAVIRADWAEVILEDGVNVQDNCTIHVFPAKSITLRKGAHVGHGAIVHGAHLGENCLIGMNAVIMDDAIIGKESIVGALAFVKANADIPPRSLVVGNPARIVKQVSDEMIAWKTAGTRLYQQLPQDCFETLEEVEPLTEIPKNRPKQENIHQPLHELLKNNKS